MFSPGALTPDQSSCSSDTGDVLISSTRVLHPDRRPGAGPRPGSRSGSVQITVRKLRGPPPLTERKKQQRRSPGQKPGLGSPRRGAADSEAGDDVLTSRFTVGGRGVVLAALKQRSHSAPRRREVRVQLLDQRPLQTTTKPPDGTALSSQDATGDARVQTEAALSSGCQGDASNAAAAAAAAAMTAAAPLIKAQSDMEARVSQLADGVQKLLQADREGVDRGRSLSQQMLQHLETLQSQQLQLQSQLLESAFKIVSGHASSTSDLAASRRPAHLQVTHLDAAANSLSAQPPSSTPTVAPPAAPVTMETCHRDRWPDQTRDEQYLRDAPRISMGERSHLQSLANHSWEAARRANDVLQEMKRLKTEMKILLRQPEDPLKTTRPALDHLQSQQNQSQPQQNQSYQTRSQEEHFCSQSSQFQQNLSRENHLRSQQNQSHSQRSQFRQNHSQQNHPCQTISQENHFWSQPSEFQQSQSHEKHLQFQHNHQTSLHQTKSQHNQFQQNHSHEKHLQFQQKQSQQKQSQSHQASYGENNLWSQPSQSNQSQQSWSVQVQRRPVVPSLVEEAGQVLRQVRRQKKVLEDNLEALLRAKTGEVLHCQLEALAANRDHSEEVRIKKTVDAWISRLTRDIQAEMSSGDAGVHRSAADAVVTSRQMAAGGSTHRGKGRPVGMLRGTGSRATVRRGSREQRAGLRPPQGAEPNRAKGRPQDSNQLEVDGESYLTRLYGRAPYDGLRRTLKKSPYLRLSSPASPLGRKPRPRLVESVRGVKLKSCKTQTSLAPPLTQAQPIILAPPFSSSSPGQQQIFSSSNLTSGNRDDLTLTPADSHRVAMAIPLGRPRMDSSSRCERPREVTSQPAAPPTPSVDDGVPEWQEQHRDADEAPPPLPPPSHTVNIIEGKAEEEEEEEEEEENVFPGTDFLSVADVVQEASVSGEEAVELGGGPSPPPVLYQGPVFPPKAPSALPPQDQTPIPGLDLQRDALEDRLVEWVEQQLMSRMISEMYRPLPSDPAQNNNTDQSDLEERSVTSDIVEAAGDAGLQLFVDSNVPVDSALIRQLVDEVLTETITLMLGQRDPLGTGPEPGQEPPKSGPAAHQEDKLVLLVPTPEPTPPPSPAPPSREATAVTTPPPSEPTSPLNKEPPEPITAESVATPTLSPEPAISVGSPSAVHQVPPSFTWEDAELPLDEERLVENVDTHKPPLLMSVAEEEPPLSSPHPPPPLSLPSARSLSPPPERGPASPSSSSEDSSSSSSTVTARTEAALKHISEGELLISVNQLAAMTEGEAVCSFNSSLQELQDMDFDPPSEGQVKGRDLLRALLTKMEQGVTQRGERPQPEGSWGREDEEVSVGEVRDDQSSKPHGNACPTQRGQTSSPGQISQAADVSEVSFEATNQSSFTVGNLTGEPMGTLTSDLHTELSLSPPPHLDSAHTPGQVLLVRKYDRQTAGEEEEEEGGARRWDVHLPHVTPQEEGEVMEESVSAAADSDSTSDFF